jgi:hypothetical protein
VGEAIVRLCGLGRAWLSPGVGLAALTVLVAALVEVPGDVVVAVAGLVAATVAALAGLWVSRRTWRRDATARPGLDGVLTGGLVLLAALIPFAVNGRFGLLGVSINNDTRLHL